MENVPNDRHDRYYNSTFTNNKTHGPEDGQTGLETDAQQQEKHNGHGNILYIQGSIKDCLRRAGQSVCVG